jgi:4'-phosphopantetheinyl transferase
MTKHSRTHEGIDWPEPPGLPDLDQNAVHVWAAALDGEASSVEGFLTPAELDRAARFHFDLHRRRFIVGRGSLRVILGRYLQAESRTLEFSYGPHGKPALAGAFAASGLYFNLAHSEDLALLAVTRLGPVGVDLEKVGPLDDMDELVARFFSPRENSRFAQLSKEQKPSAFFNLWTRKEALLKATGEGIGQSLNQVEVSFLPGEPAKLLTLPDHFSQGTRWSLHNLHLDDHFAGALVVDGEKINLRCWRWNQPMTQSAKRAPVA